jgi:hypothetical protein
VAVNLLQWVGVAQDIRQRLEHGRPDNGLCVVGI